jgi:isoleucyl-tRNA synthetase
MASAASETTSKPFADFPEEEERIIQFWKDCDAFRKSYELSLQEGRKPYVFYDGPPFATVCSLKILTDI